ncbi:Agamous-like MADS-box protein AGL80 [Rhynchospora pubera]|uniref:Agamous-like MADS-box protein AGL80 n=1 Tax=Rhynchospora pubera TaxID=906938 RepID=A0AAV8C8U6_9POAL|nr:Agamous-like MADS-box protein AGL80 [Rhynchospora pubera]KAJ4795174.1 Agamous-like MADS-box protein AGL80 [Rhynchospora pubera]
MARKKVNLVYIQNDATRRATYKKRKKGLIKKAHELSTLCGVDTCVVIYGQQDPKPEVWASPNKDARQVLTQFKNMPQLDQCKKMVNQEGFLRMNVAKARERLFKVDRENNELEIKLLMHEVITGQRSLSELTMAEMTELVCVMEMRHKAVQERLNQHRSGAGMFHNVNSEMMIVQEEEHVVPMAPAVQPNEEKIPVDAEVRSWLNHDGLNFGCSEEMTMMMMMPMGVEGASAFDSHFAVN